jgi:hypothetical protein
MKSLRARVLLVHSFIFGIMFALTTEGATLISVNNAAFGNGPIQTFDFTIGQQVNSFIPDGATSVNSNGNANGRAIAIQGNEIFYTEVFGFGQSDGIHVAPYATAGYGGRDTRVLPSPRSTSGIQDLAFHNGKLYALTGYDADPLEVFELDPITGSVITGPINIASPAQPDSDGFVVLTNGNFLINDGDESTVYREYDGTTGNLVSGGLVIDLSAFGFGYGTGACLAPDGHSLYFCADFGVFVQTDLAGSLIASQSVGGSAFEELAVVQTPSCDIYARNGSITDSGSNFTFNVFGPTGSVWNVYSSTNLTNWAYVTNLTIGSGSVDFTDGTISGVPYRFYKLSDSNCCSQAIGFTRIQVGAGTTNYPGTNSMLANQLDAPQNTLDGLFNVNGSGVMPDGTALPNGSVIIKWDDASQAFLYYTWNSGWLDGSGNNAGNVTLNPGEGGFLVVTNPLTATFVGLVKDGALSLPLTANQFHIISSMIPKAGLLQSQLSYVGQRFDEIQQWTGSTYIGNEYVFGHWGPAEPVLRVGEAMFWNGGTNNTWHINYSPCN